MKEPLPTSIRLDAELNDALERAAAQEERPKSKLIVRILREWAVKNGFLANPERRTK